MTEGRLTLKQRLINFLQTCLFLLTGLHYIPDPGEVIPPPPPPPLPPYWFGWWDLPSKSDWPGMIDGKRVGYIQIEEKEPLRISYANDDAGKPVLEVFEYEIGNPNTRILAKPNKWLMVDPFGDSYATENDRIRPFQCSNGILAFKLLPWQVVDGANLFDSMIDDPLYWEIKGAFTVFDPNELMEV